MSAKYSFASPRFYKQSFRVSFIFNLLALLSESAMPIIIEPLQPLNHYLAALSHENVGLLQLSRRLLSCMLSQILPVGFLAELEPVHGWRNTGVTLPENPEGDPTLSEIHQREARVFM
ncbi:hypothetical protein Tco_1203087 [Tanacetum coccineum]